MRRIRLTTPARVSTTSRTSPWARLQLQLYNGFNTPQLNQLNTALQFQDDPTVPGLDSLLLNSTLQGRYTAANPPREFGVTFRVDF